MFIILIFKIVLSAEIINSDFFKEVYDLSYKMENGATVKRNTAQFTGREMTAYIVDLLKKIKTGGCKEALSSSTDLSKLTSKFENFFDDISAIMHERFDNKDHLSHSDFMTKLNKSITDHMTETNLPEFKSLTLEFLAEILNQSKLEKEVEFKSKIIKKVFFN